MRSGHIRCRWCSWSTPAGRTEKEQDCAWQRLEAHQEDKHPDEAEQLQDLLDEPEP
jgi:hypothetical protein